MLKRHLMTSYEMTPDQYRAKWNLKADYPMVAPSYSIKRGELAKQIGLGRKPKALGSRRSRSLCPRQPEYRGRRRQRRKPRGYSERACAACSRRGLRATLSRLSATSNALLGEARSASPHSMERRFGARGTFQTSEGKGIACPGCCPFTSVGRAGAGRWGGSSTSPVRWLFHMPI